MLDWLNVNYGAVQGIASFITVILTAVLVWATTRYVHLTHKIASVASKQLSASMQPVLVLRCETPALIKTPNGMVVTVSTDIMNAGSSPVKLLNASVYIMYGIHASSNGVRYDIYKDESLVLMPNDPIPKTMDWNLAKVVDRAVHWSMAVYCTDLAGISKHSFFCDDERQLRHEFGFREDKR